MIRVRHTLNDLASDMAAAPVEFAAKVSYVVLRNAEQGNTIAQRLAQAEAGPHGTAYHKRLSAELTGHMSAEYGPEGIPKTEFVGAGWRNSGPNMDLPNSADIIGPKFADAVGDLADGLYW